VADDPVDGVIRDLTVLGEIDIQHRQVVHAEGEHRADPQHRADNDHCPTERGQDRVPPQARDERAGNGSHAGDDCKDDRQARQAETFQRQRISLRAVLRDQIFFEAEEKAEQQKADGGDDHFAVQQPELPGGILGSKEGRDDDE